MHDLIFTQRTRLVEIEQALQLVSRALPADRAPYVLEACTCMRAAEGLLTAAIARAESTRAAA